MMASFDHQVPAKPKVCHERQARKEKASTTTVGDNLSRYEIRKTLTHCAGTEESAQSILSSNESFGNPGCAKSVSTAARVQAKSPNDRGQMSHLGNGIRP